MDYQTLINIGAGSVLAVAGWFTRELWGAVQDLRKDLGTLREEIAKGYISKDDFRDALRELKEMLQNIDSKLDRKQDK